MPGGSAAVLASKFRGLNRFVPPYLLDPAQSPDCADCAAYNGKSGLLGPRAGRKFLSNYTNKVRGVIPVNLNWTKFFLVAQGDGSITPVSSPAPSPPIVGFCSSAEYMNRNPGAGPTGPSGSRIYFSAMWNESGRQCNPGSGIGLGFVPLDHNTQGVGLSGFTFLGGSYSDGNGTQVTCSPNCDLIEGYTRGGLYSGSNPWGFILSAYDPGHSPDFIMTVMSIDDGVKQGAPSPGGTAFPKGASLTFTLGTLPSPMYIF